MEKASKKKILFYNWVQFDKKNNPGGGVNVYQKNIIEYFINNTDNEIYFLSSGMHYNFINRKMYVKKSKNIYGGKCKSFKLYNSKCIAPAKTMGQSFNSFINDDEIYLLFKKFISECGGFDVIHFNNIEGLSSKCLEIKKDFPNTKVVYSVHNYFLMCPQVNLFFNNDVNCMECKNKLCTKCLNNNISEKKSKVYYMLDTFLEKIKMEKFSIKIKSILKKINANKKKKHKSNNDILFDYDNFRKLNIERINNYVDVVLAVSDRVKKICTNFGISENKIITNYIGTKFSTQFNKKIRETINVNDKHLKITYMGYFDKAKGFDFMIDAFNQLDKKIAMNIELSCYAKIKSSEDIEKLEKLKLLEKKLGKVIHYDGYTHDDFKSIMDNTDLGLVPVIWEDNLPQVSIEFIANGVPILCSDFGGAQENVHNKNYVFKGNNIKDFIKKLTNIIKCKEILNTFDFNSVNLISMQDHIDKLQTIYGGNNE